MRILISPIIVNKSLEESLIMKLKVHTHISQVFWFLLKSP